MLKILILKVHTAAFGNFGDSGKATRRPPSRNLTCWIITQSKGFARKNGYLVITSQFQARSSIVGNSASAVDPQQFLRSTFNAVINKDYSVSIDIHYVDRACIIKSEFFSRYRRLYASKSVKLEHWKNCRIQH